MADRVIMQRALDANGDPVSGARASFTQPGTATAVNVYSDEDGTISLGPLVVSGASGEWPPIYTTQAVAITVTNGQGVELPGNTLDPHPIVPPGGSSAANVTFSPIEGNAATDAQTAIANNTSVLNGATDYARTLWEANSAENMRQRLQLGTAATENVVNTGALEDDDLMTVGYNKQVRGYNLATEQVVVGGEAEIEFDNIPDWATEISVFCRDVSFSSADGLRMQLGTSSAYQTTAYEYVVSTQDGPSASFALAAATNGFSTYDVSGNNTTTYILSKPFSSNVWICRMMGMRTEAGLDYNDGHGSVSLSGALTRLKLASNVGSNTFSTGTINIGWK